MNLLVFMRGIMKERVGLLRGNPKKSRGGEMGLIEDVTIGMAATEN
jgi:hypothetical protein